MEPVANSEIKIKSFDFSDIGILDIFKEDKGSDWPVVYILHNDNEVYVGETSNAVGRMKQHLQTEKKRLSKTEIIFDDTFNKSAILDIEQRLIQLYSVDGKYKLINANGGQSTTHNYYQREGYVSKIDRIRQSLRELKLTNKSINEIRNSDLFKFSPYTSLTEEQSSVSQAIIKDMMKKLLANKDGTAIIKGGAGTGKTIVIINMIYKLINAGRVNFDKAIDEDSDFSEYVQFIHDLQNFVKEYKGEGGVLNIAYVSPMTALRKTLKVVFSETKKGLKGNLVMGPCDVVTKAYESGEKFDIVFVDEAHRLAQRKNIGWMGAFDTAARRCGMEPTEANALDFIVKNSKYRVLVYDEKQTVKGADITKQQLKYSLRNSICTEFELTTQMRCKGGDTYLKYVSDILDCEKGLSKKEINNYEFKLYYNIDKMISKIKDLDKEFGLCRNMCSESRPWISQHMKYEDIIREGKQDIAINGYKYPWNTRIEGWIISETAINEIGCIHTVQGYDLNYAGLIFGREIDYNELTGQITINKDMFFSNNIKQGVSDAKLKEYILNAYKVMLTRGIRGCFVYAFNEGLRKYLSRFIDVAD